MRRTPLGVSGGRLLERVLLTGARTGSRFLVHFSCLQGTEKSCELRGSFDGWGQADVELGSASIPTPALPTVAPTAPAPPAGPSETSARSPSTS